MKATEFIKKFGLMAAKKHLVDVREAVNQVPHKHSLEDFSIDLKRLVESHELVDLWGGIGRCKFFMMGMKLNKCDSVKCPKTGMITSKTKLEQAIADVESCQKLEGE